MASLIAQKQKEYFTSQLQAQPQTPFASAKDLGLSLKLRMKDQVAAVASRTTLPRYVRATHVVQAQRRVVWIEDWCRDRTEEFVSSCDLFE